TSVVDAMIATGEGIRQAVARIAAISDGDGGFDANTALFEALFAQYRAALNEFDNAVRGVEQNYIELNMRIPETNDFYGPWQHEFDQGTTRLPKLTSIAGPLGQSLYAPPGLIAKLPEFYALAARSPGTSVTAT